MKQSSAVSLGILVLLLALCAVSAVAADSKGATSNGNSNPTTPFFFGPGQASPQAAPASDVTCENKAWYQSLFGGVDNFLFKRAYATEDCGCCWVHRTSCSDCSTDFYVDCTDGHLYGNVGDVPAGHDYCTVTITADYFYDVGASNPCPTGSDYFCKVSCGCPCDQTAPHSDCTFSAFGYANYDPDCPCPTVGHNTANSINNNHGLFRYYCLACLCT